MVFSSCCVKVRAAILEICFYILPKPSLFLMAFLISMLIILFSYSDSSLFSFFFFQPKHLDSDRRRRMERWRPTTSERVSSPWDTTWWEMITVSSVLGFLFSFSFVVAVCWLHPCSCFSGRGGVRPYHDPGGPQRHRHRVLPVLHRLHDQRDGRYRHRRAGGGVLPHPGSGQGMCCVYIGAAVSVPARFMNHALSDSSPTSWWRSWGENFPQNRQSTASWGCLRTKSTEHRREPWTTPPSPPPSTERATFNPSLSDAQTHWPSWLLVLVNS